MRNEFLALTGHVSHIPEESIQVAHGTGDALKGLFSLDSLAGAVAIYMGTRNKGAGSHLGALSEIKTNRTAPAIPSGPDKYQQLSEISHQIGEQKKKIKAAPESQRDKLRDELKKLESRRDTLRHSLIPPKRLKK